GPRKGAQLRILTQTRRPTGRRVYYCRCPHGAARKGGTPGEGSPFDPLLRLERQKETSRGAAPGPRPLFCKNAGQKTFTGPDFCLPKRRAPAEGSKRRG